MKQKDLKHIIACVRIARSTKETSDAMNKLSLAWRNMQITEALEKL